MGNANVHSQEFVARVPGCQVGHRGAWDALLNRVAEDFPHSCVVLTDDATPLPFG